MRALLTAWGRSRDWPLVILLAGFLVNLAFICTMGSILIDPFVAYKRAIAAAALKQPDYQRTLAAIDAETVNVVTFRKPRELPMQKRPFDIWVALGSEARAACSGAGNPVRKLQQIFGLPPIAAKTRVVTELEVHREGLIRPCVGEFVKASSHCEFKLSDPPAEDADAATFRDAYDRLRLVTKQMWDSYRVGFRIKTDEPSDFPYEGFPFTGMGWSYNWSGRSPNHFGVSEFVIKRDAIIKVVSEKSPADFCRSK